MENENSSQAVPSPSQPSQAPVSASAPVAPMRPLKGAGQLLQETWSVYKSKLLVSMEVLLVPVLLIALSTAIGLSFITPLVTIIATLIMFLAQGALIILLVNRGTELKIGEVYRQAWTKYWSLLWIAILTAFIVIGGFFLLVVPGIIFTIWFLFPVVILMVEGEKGMSALMKSREYARGYFWPLFGRYLVVILVAMIFYIVAGSILGLIFGASTLGGFLVNLLSLLIMPFIVGYNILLYEDLKSVKDQATLAPKPKAKTTYLLIGAVGWVLLVVVVTVVFAFSMAALGWIMGGGLDNIKILPEETRSSEMTIDIPSLLGDRGEGESIPASAI